MNIQLSNEWRYLVIICIASVIVMLPIAIFGIPDGNDLPQHFQFAQAFYNSILHGDGFPNWSSDENFGYGSIGIRFYPPLSYYVLAFARVITGSWFDAAWLAFVFWMAVGCVGVYVWSRWWLSPKESLIAAIFYAFSTYHLNQLYISFVYADFAGAAILPFCFAFLTRIQQRRKYTDILCFALSYAALVLTHLPTTIIGSLSLAVYSLALLKKNIFVSQLGRACAGVAIGLVASSFYWLRMVAELNWLNHASEQYSSGHYYFANQFFPLSFHTATGYIPDLVQVDVQMAVCGLFLASPIVYLAYKKTRNEVADLTSHIFRTVLPMGVIAFIMLTPISYPIWKILPFLQKIQFPLRWMSVVAMCGAVVTAASVHFLIKGDLLKQRVWSYCSLAFVAIFLTINITYIWYPSSFVPIARDKFEAEMQDLASEKNRTFWWSIWSKDKALENKEKVSTPDRLITVTDWKPEERSFTVENGREQNARIATFWYPRWQAEVNGNPVTVGRDENGAILIPIPAEQARVRLWFQEPPLFTVAAVISMLTWLLLFSAIALGLLMRLRRRKSEHTRQEIFAT